MAGSAGSHSVPSTTEILRIDYPQVEAAINKLEQVYEDLLQVKAAMDARIAPIAQNVNKNDIWRGRADGVFSDLWTSADQVWDPQVEVRLETLINVLPQIANAIANSDSESSSLFGDLQAF
jgi:uncharacterized protein YukE